MSLQVDPKTKNLSIFVSKYVLGIISFIYVFIKVTGETNPIKLIGYFVVILFIWRILLWLYRRFVLSSNLPSYYGKWAIILDNGDLKCTLTSAFIAYLTKYDMSFYIISSNHTKLDSFKNHLELNYHYNSHNMKLKYYDFKNTTCQSTSSSSTSSISSSAASYASSTIDSFAEFYKEFDTTCQELDAVDSDDSNSNHNNNSNYDNKSSSSQNKNNNSNNNNNSTKNSRIGLFINSGFYSRHHMQNNKKFDDYEDDEMDGVMSHHIIPIVRMTSIVLKYMKLHHKGAIIHITSSCVSNYTSSSSFSSSFSSIPSAISAFMIQFSRSMHVECWGSGVDFLTLTPVDRLLGVNDDDDDDDDVKAESVTTNHISNNSSIDDKTNNNNINNNIDNNNDSDDNNNNRSSNHNDYSSRSNNNNNNNNSSSSNNNNNNSNNDNRSLNSVEMKINSTLKNNISNNDSNNNNNNNNNDINISNNDNSNNNHNNNDNNINNNDNHHSLVTATMSQLGKRYVWQVYGTWWMELCHWTSFMYDPTGWCYCCWYNLRLQFLRLQCLRAHHLFSYSCKGKE